MAKKKMSLDPNDEDFGQEVDTEIDAEDEAPRGKLTKEQYLKFKKNYSTLKQKASDVTSPIGDLIKKLEEEGGEKLAFKLSEKLLEMEPIKRSHVWRELTQYLNWGGFFDQEDLVDAAEGIDPVTGKKKAA